MITVYKSKWNDQRAKCSASAAAICDAYASGVSTQKVAAQFGVSKKTVLNILRRNGREIRSLSKARAILFEDPDFRANHVAKRVGKPAWNKGKSYTLTSPVSKPSLRGDGNPQWKGGRLTWALRVRKSGEYQFWRRSIFERDGYLCVQCGAGGRLEADHIVAFSKIMDMHGVRSYEDAMACVALWDTTNGRTLCKPCHRGTDTYGARSAKKRA